MEEMGQAPGQIPVYACKSFLSRLDHPRGWCGKETGPIYTFTHLAHPGDPCRAGQRCWYRWGSIVSPAAFGLAESELAFFSQHACKHLGKEIPSFSFRILIK